jgi:hypothetical protein
MLFSVAVIIRSWDHLLFLEIFPFGQGGHRLEQTSNRALPSHAPFLFGNMRHQDYSQLSDDPTWQLQRKKLSIKAVKTDRSTVHASPTDCESYILRAIVNGVKNTDMLLFLLSLCQVHWILLHTLCCSAWQSPLCLSWWVYGCWFWTNLMCGVYITLVICGKFSSR